MVKPPARVRVGPHIYRISTDPSVLRHYEREVDHELDGYCDHANLTIAIKRPLEHTQQADTVLHEVLHAICSQTGITHDTGGDDEERLIQRLAPALLAVLRSNPSLVDYLTGG